ncbi:MAG: Mrp/NBP35 family ATP-binding protein [bacterium]
MSGKKNGDRSGDTRHPPPAEQRGAGRRSEEGERETLRKRLGKIRHKIVVMSGKGGVGKSTVAVNAAMSLALEGYMVGLLDLDIHGPSIPRMLNMEGARLTAAEDALLPPFYVDNLKVMSIGFMLKRASDAVIWRGPAKMLMVKQFLMDVEWGELDYLVIDSPPGTGDEPLSIFQLIEDLCGAVIVTTPQAVSVIDVGRAITFCRRLNISVIGLVENMSGMRCPHCGKDIELFKTGGGEKLAAEAGVPLLSRIPIDPEIVETSDTGVPYVYRNAKSETAAAMEKIAAAIIAKTTTPAA